jgi:hypothetical protein
MGLLDLIQTIAPLVNQSTMAPSDLDTPEAAPTDEAKINELMARMRPAASH